jgi:hypothetical protein
MSELRDLTAAFRAFSERLTGIEDCLVILARNSEQETDWRHQQRNDATVTELRWEEQERAMKQVQDGVGALSKRVVDLHDEVKTLAIVRYEDTREMKGRLNALEADHEVTKA